MPDLPALRPAHESRLSGGERREVVVVDVALGLLRVERVDHLVHPQHPERRDVQHLRLAALEEPGAVRAGDESDLGGELADLLDLAAVETDAVLDHSPAHQGLLQLLERGGDLRRALGGGLLAPRLLQVGLELLLEGGQAVLPLVLAGNERFTHAVAGEGLDLAIGLRGIERLRLERLLLDLHPGEELELRVDRLPDRALGGLEALGNDLLVGRRRAFLDEAERRVGRLALDHQDVDRSRLVAAPRDHDVERRVLELLVGRVDDPLAVDVAHADGADRAVERQAREHRREARRVDPGDVVRVLEIRGQDEQHDVHLVAVALGERRTERPVDQPRGERGGLRGLALATEEAARDLPRGVHPLLDVDRERKEIDALARLAAGARGEDHRLAERDDGRAAGLLRELARLERHIRRADALGDCGGHWRFLLMDGSRARRAPPRATR